MFDFRPVPQLNNPPPQILPSDARPSRLFTYHSPGRFLCLSITLDDQEEFTYRPPPYRPAQRRVITLLQPFAHIYRDPASHHQPLDYIARAPTTLHERFSLSVTAVV